MRSTTRSTLLCLFLFAATASGCGTVRGLDASWPEPEFFPGVRTDFADISNGGVGMLSTIDVPLSLVADVVLVPVHAILYVRSQMLTPPHDGTQFELRKTEDYDID